VILSLPYRIKYHNNMLSNSERRQLKRRPTLRMSSLKKKKRKSDSGSDDDGKKNGKIETINYQRDEYGVPLIVSECIKFIHEKGLKEMGIFRISPDSSKQDRFLHTFQRGNYVDLLNEPGVDCHLAAGLLKAYYRTLPLPIYPRDFYSSLLSSNDIDNTQQINLIKDLIKTHIKVEDLNNLTVLFNLLREISIRSEENLMPANNIAICFSPTLFHAGNEAQDSVVIMIEFCEQIFGKLSNMAKINEFIRPQPIMTEVELLTMSQNDIDHRTPTTHKRGLLVKMRRNSSLLKEQKKIQKTTNTSGRNCNYRGITK